MKAVILAGGLGTRLSEETVLKPKPLVEIGDKPILWHIMKIYASHGINEFIICLGYKGYMIKEYFYNYIVHNSDISVDMANNSFEILSSNKETWKVSLIDTGLNTMTGGRLKRIANYIGNDDFCLTYGDGVSNIDITESIRFHKNHKRIATLSAVKPGGRFGALQIQNRLVTKFHEKPDDGQGLINGGFFVLSPRVLDFIDGDDTVFEKEPLETLAMNEELVAYHHTGFWQCMDTIRDKQYLNDLWNNENTPWKMW